MRQIVCDICGNAAKLFMRTIQEDEDSYAVYIVDPYSHAWQEHRLTFAHKQSDTSHCEEINLCPECAEKYSKARQAAQVVFNETMSAWWREKLKRGDVEIYEGSC